MYERYVKTLSYMAKNNSHIAPPSYAVHEPRVLHATTLLRGNLQVGGSQTWWLVAQRSYQIFEKLTLPETNILLMEGIRRSSAEM